MKEILNAIEELKQDIELDICGNWNKSVDARITDRIIDILKNLEIRMSELENINSKNIICR